MGTGKLLMRLVEEGDVPVLVWGENIPLPKRVR